MGSLGSGGGSDAGKSQRAFATGGWSDIQKDPSATTKSVATGGISNVTDMMNTGSAKKAEEAQSAEDQARQQEYEQRTGTMGSMGETADKAYQAQQDRLKGYESQRTQADASADLADRTYQDSLKNAEYGQQRSTRELMDRAESQANSANKTYSESIQPSYKNAMEKADQNASQAMSLSEAGDMNNKVQQGVRDFFNTQASNEQRSGVADVGVLQSLGAQANAQQMGAGAPMTGAQMQLMQSGNAQQAGQAFANVQKRMQNLRQQGVEQGISQSAAQYQRGQQAQEAAASRRGQFMGAEGAQAERTAAQRGERNQYGQDITRSQKNIGAADYNSSMSQYQRGQARANQFYNADTGMANQRLGDVQSRAMMQQDINLGKLSDERMKAYGQMQAANAQIAANNQMVGGVAQGAGTAVGAYFGGPMGAQAGSSVGGAVGQGMGSSNPYANQPPPQRSGGGNTYGGYGGGGYGA